MRLRRRTAYYHYNTTTMLIYYTLILHYCYTSLYLTTLLDYLLRRNQAAAEAHRALYSYTALYYYFYTILYYHFTLLLP